MSVAQLALKLIKKLRQYDFSISFFEIIAITPSLMVNFRSECWKNASNGNCVNPSESRSIQYASKIGVFWPKFVRHVSKPFSIN
jgi:hypothetical protein